MNPHSDLAPALDGGVRLAHLGLMRARGADAVKFLQSQLTSDIASLDTTQARPAGFCSAKGRLQASFVVWKTADGDVLLICSASVLAATLARLSMFVMRAQCKLGDAGADTVLWGLAGDSALRRLGDAAVWERRSLADEAGAALIRLPDAAGRPRALWVAPPADAAPDVAPLSLEAWRWLEVQSGLPTIEAATAEQFVPQMVNFERIGGVDFQKGCYPGQEVVARSQYRGTVKRRMFLFDVDAPAAAGQDVFHSADPAQPAGMVVNAAPRPEGGGSSALVEVKLAALESGELRLGDAAGALLRRAALPYAVQPDDAA